jgi:hypothetical protein
MTLDARPARPRGSRSAMMLVSVQLTQRAGRLGKQVVEGNPILARCRLHFFDDCLSPASAASGASPSFLAAKPSRTVASSLGSDADTLEESALRKAMPQYFSIAAPLRG